jgi:hypothetical protein
VIGESWTGPPGIEVERTWSLFGVCLATGHRFVNRVSEGCSSPDLRFRYVDAPPLRPGWDANGPAYASPTLIDDRTSWLYVYQRAPHTVMRFSGVAEFYLGPDHIDCYVIDSVYDYMVELHLIGYVMSVWLELRGVTMLHTAAVVIDEHAVGFLATNKGGKTSLVASLMQHEHRLLTDDILPLQAAGDQVIAHPGYPQMRMWPDQADHFVGGHDGLELVHPRLSKRRVPVGAGGFGAFAKQRAPLGVLYLPRRADTDTVEFEAVSFGEAILCLAQNSFAVGIVEAIGLESERFARLASIARAVPLIRVTYPEGNHRLAAVSDAIVRDLRTRLTPADVPRGAAVS